MNPTIKHINGTVLYEGEVGMTTRQLLEKSTQSGANLSWVDLSWVDLRGANLRGATLSGANLRGANLSEANLSEANLSEANLSGANLSGANLRRADLSWANLSWVDLSWVDLGGVDLREANLSWVYLSEKFGKLIGARPIFQVGPIGSRSDYLQSFITDKGIVIKAGCFTGFIDEFAAAVEKTHGDSDHGKEYAMAVLMIEAHAAIWQQQ